MTTPARFVTAALAAAALTVALAGCAGDGTSAAGSAGQAGDEKSITIGFNPGPYEDMFDGGIRPILEAEGYTVEKKWFTDGIVVNNAVATGEIDANIMQHAVYQDAINQQEGLHNTALVQVPTPPMALFGGKKKTLDEVGQGSTVAVPNQPSNMFRAFRVLEDAGWLTLTDTIDPATASPADIAENPHGLQIVAIENAQQVASLPDVDYSVIQGNFVVSGGLRLDDALALEKITDEYRVVVSVDEENVGAAWAQAIKTAYESPEFASFIAGDEAYTGYSIPAELKQ